MKTHALLIATLVVGLSFASQANAGHASQFPQVGPSCCAPEPTCCAPAPTCCAPKCHKPLFTGRLLKSLLPCHKGGCGPTCSAPVPTCAAPMQKSCGPIQKSGGLHLPMPKLGCRKPLLHGLFQPKCCAPAPTCCAPAPTCCGM